MPFHKKKTLLAKSIKPFKGLFLLMPLVSIASMLVALLVPYVQKKFIDQLITNSHQIWQEMILVLIFMGSAMVLKNLVSYISTYTTSKVNANMKTLFASKLFNFPQEFFRKHKSSYLAARLEIDTAKSNYFYSLEYFQPLISTIGILGALVVIGIHNYYLVIIILLGIGLQFLILKKFTDCNYQLSKKSHEISAENYGVLQQYIGNIQTIKTQVFEDNACSDISTRYHKAMDLIVKLLKLRLFSNFLFSLVPSLVKLGVVIFGVLLYQKKLWSIGDIWAMANYVNLAFAPATLLINNLLRREISRSALDRVENLYAILIEDQNESGIVLQNKISNLEMQDISFGYQPQINVLQNFSLKAKTGDVIAITGESGAGKSTLMSLLMLLYLPNSGTIKFNNLDFKEYNLKSLRKAIAYVSQEPQFFDGTLSDNLSKYATIDEQKNILKKLGLQKLISKLDDNLCEQANQFSAGERVRIAIARELLRNADVLIFDEPTANLDSETKEIIISHILEDLKVKIVFIISHDQMVIDRCQEKIVLSKEE